MNFSDAEVVMSILDQNGFTLTKTEKNANIHLILTCSIREKAEQKIFNRLQVLNSIRRGDPQYKIGILGCMAERLKTSLFDKNMVNVVCGPDSYKDLPRLLNSIDGTETTSANVSF